MRRILKFLFIATLCISLILGVAMFALFSWQEREFDKTFQRSPFTLPTPDAEAIVMDDMIESTHNIVLDANEVEYWIWQQRPPQLVALNLSFVDNKYHLQASWDHNDGKYSNITAVFSVKWNPAEIPIEYELQNEFELDSMRGYWTDLEFDQLILGEQNLIEWQTLLGLSGKPTSEIDFLTPIWIDFRQSHPEAHALFQRVEDCKLQNNQLLLILHPTEDAIQ